MKKIENYFANKEIRAFYLCENLQKDYFANLKEKSITDNKHFWKTAKPFLPKKKSFSERINPTEEEDSSLLTNCEEIAKELNNLFANTVKSLTIPNYKNCDCLAENIDDPTLNVIVTWRNHLSILAVASKYKNRAHFFFNFVSKEDILAEIKVLDVF